MTDDSNPGFSRIIKASAIGTAPEPHHIVATPAECAGIAKLFNLPAIASLTGDFLLHHQAAGTIAAELRMAAKITQTCVITLEDFSSRITESALMRLVPAATCHQAEAAPFSPETLDAPDEIPYPGDTIDLAAILAEQLALALDPYPRKPGASLPPPDQDAPENPFAILQPRMN